MADAALPTPSSGHQVPAGFARSKLDAMRSDRASAELEHAFAGLHQARHVVELASRLMRKLGSIEASPQAIELVRLVANQRVDAIAGGASGDLKRLIADAATAAKKQA